MNEKHETNLRTKVQDNGFKSKSNSFHCFQMDKLSKSGEDFKAMRSGRANMNESKVDFSF